jgi:putative ABC transport system ATP-binding protein
LIEVRGISKAYGARDVWSDLAFTAEPGRMLALTGQSGTGKSTLLNCIGLLEEPDSGSIHVDGDDITRYRPGRARAFRRDRLGYLFQNYALVENATASRNLDIAVQPRRRKMTYKDALGRVGLSGIEKEMVYHLSGGEQQRLALARLLIKGPSIVLADEPTGALDTGNATLVIELLREMSDSGCTVIVATHNEMVERECDDVLRLSRSSAVHADIP